VQYSYKELVHFFEKLPDTNSYFLEKITSGMVCPAHYIPFISSVKLFEISQKKAIFEKTPWRFFFNIFFNIFFKKFAMAFLQKIALF